MTVKFPLELIGAEMYVSKVPKLALCSQTSALAVVGTGIDPYATCPVIEPDPVTIFNSGTADTWPRSECVPSVVALRSPAASGVVPLETGITRFA